MSDSSLTIELHNRLSYDKETGLFTWRVSAGRVSKGSIAGSLSHGYVRIHLLGREYWAHRLAWLYEHGQWPSGQIDHINGDRADNRLQNLRDVSGSSNQQNQRRPQSDNKSSAYLGVSRRDNRSKKWRATITLDGKHMEIGSYGTELEAHEAYLAKKRLIHAGCTI